DLPPTGMGGFGTSRFFGHQAYQTGFTSGSRSIPDVVVNADPHRTGIFICQADRGGCPTPFRVGGTSMAAPVWAALAALLDEAHGSKPGFLNPLIYPLAATRAFHAPASMGSDFAHAGIGSPNHDALSLALDGATFGAVSPSISVLAALQPQIA